MNIPLIESEIDSLDLNICDKSWDAIKEVVKDEPQCYDKSYRGARVREALKRTAGLHKSTI